MAVKHNLPETGILKLSTVLKLIPVSRSTWFSGQKAGRYPKPIKLGPRATGYRIEDIRALMARGVE